MKIGVVPMRWKTSGFGGGGAASGGGSGGVDLPSELASSRSQGSIPVAKGVLDIGFGYQNLAASLTVSRAYRVIPGVTVTLAQQGVQMLFRGSVVGLALRSTSSISTGSATFGVYLEGVSSRATLVWTSGNRDYTTFPVGAYTFDSGEELDVRVTTSSSFAPTTNVEVIAYVTFDAE